MKRSPRPRRCWQPGLWTGQEVPGTKAKLLADGTAAAPADAPEQVKQAIWAANSLQDLPYSYGGGHNLKFNVAKGADCSGTVSFALHGGDLLDSPLDSGSFMKWGEKGKGALDHRLHEPRPRLRGHRRPPARHERRRHVAHDEDEGRRQGVRVRPALAPDAALRPRLRQASPDVLLVPPRSSRHPAAAECCGRVRLMQTPTRR